MPRRSRTAPLFFTILVSISLSLGCSKQDAENTPPRKSGEERQRVVNDTRQSDQPGISTDTNREIGQAPKSATPTAPQKDNAAFRILDISERSHEGKNVITMTFSSALNRRKEFQSYFNVEIAQQDKRSQRQGQTNNDKGRQAVSDSESTIVEGAWELDEGGKLARFPNTRPDTHYNITVTSGLEAQNGKQLRRTVTETLTTRRLTPSVNFDTQGVFIRPGENAHLPVVAVNIDKVDIDFFRAKPSQLGQFLQNIGGSRRSYWGVESITRHADLVHSARFLLDGPENTRVERSIGVAEIPALNEPGIYLAIMRRAGDYQKKHVLWFSITDIGMHARRYPQQLDIFASSLASGKPLSQVSIRLLSRDNKLIKEVKTSADGLASFTGKFPKAYYAVAESKQHTSLIQLKKPTLDLTAFDLGSRPQKPTEIFIYTARDLFRPNETIDFNALIRDGDGQLKKAPPLTATLKRPDGSTAASFRWAAKKQGYYHHQWHIPEKAPVGNWRLDVRGPLKAPVSYAFKVEEFLPERLKLEFSSAKTHFDENENVSINTVGEYLYGAPAANNRLSTMVDLGLWRYPVSTLKDFEFGDINRQQKIQQHFQLDDIALDGQGHATINIPSRWKKEGSPLRVKITSSLYESGGRPVSRSHSALVWPAKNLIGIRPHFRSKKNQTGHPEANSRVSFDIVNTTVDGQLNPAKNLEVQLVREDRQYFWSFDDHRGWHWQWSDKEYVEQSRNLNLVGGTEQNPSPQELTATVEFPVQWGDYRLEVTNPETGLISSLRFYAGYNWYADWQRAQQGGQAVRPEKVTLALDKARYQPGDVARLTIVPPEDGQALILVEGDYPLWNKTIAVETSGNTVEIPIEKEWDTHNLYISALVIQPAGKNSRLTPKRSFGLTHLPLDREHRRLAIDIETPEKIEPNTTLNAKIHVSHNAGKKVHLTLAAVDIGILSISNFETPDPHEYFFGQRRYDIAAQDMYQQVVEQGDLERAHLQYGGDADLTRGGNEPVSKVQIVSLFSGLVDVTNNGEANVDLNIPDFNGRLRIMALAFSDNAFGSAEQELTVAAPIVTQIAMPRFLALGDTSTIALDLRNMTTEQHHMEVTFSATGPVRITGSTKQQIQLAPQEKATLLFPVEASDYRGAATFTLNVSPTNNSNNGSTHNSNINDFQRQWSLGVRPAHAAMTSTERKVLAQGEQFVPHFLSTLRSQENPEGLAILKDTLASKLTVNNYVDINLSSQMKHLLQYPYGCLEQTTSRAFPLLYATAKHQRRFGLNKISEDKRLDMINKGIQRIASLQLNNGAYGLWNNRSREQHWLTAYAADFLISARDLGHRVPEQLLNDNLSRLKRYVNKSGRFVGERWSDDTKHYTFSYKAYASYVLARVNQAPLGSMRVLFDTSINDAKSGLPQLQLGLALTMMGDKKRGNQAIEKALNSTPQVARYLGDYGSRLRDLGMMIHLLKTHTTRHPDAARLSLDLAEARQERQWLSTQERTSMFLAGAALANTQGEIWKAELDVNGVKQSIEKNTGYSRVLSSEELHPAFTLISRNDGPLFVSAETIAHPLTAPEPMGNGLSIAREFYSLKGEAIDASQLTVGSLVLVHLNVVAEKRMPDALVVDLLPAGLELENQNLDSAVAIGEVLIQDQSIAQLQNAGNIKHQEYRDDRYVAALDLRGRRGAHLFYLARAVTPGQYNVPAPMVEDMYRPELRAIGATHPQLTVENP